LEKKKKNTKKGKRVENAEKKKTSELGCAFKDNRLKYGTKKPCNIFPLCKRKNETAGKGGQEKKKVKREKTQPTNTKENKRERI